MDSHLVKHQCSNILFWIQTTLYDLHSSLMTYGKVLYQVFSFFYFLGKLDINLEINSVPNLEEWVTAKTGWDPYLQLAMCYQLKFVCSSKKKLKDQWPEYKISSILYTCQSKLR